MLTALFRKSDMYVLVPGKEQGLIIILVQIARVAVVDGSRQKSYDLKVEPMCARGSPPHSYPLMPECVHCRC